VHVSQILKSQTTCKREKYTQMLILLIMLLSCSSTEKNNAILPDTMNNDNSKRTFLALGDSYTIGESVDEKDRWSMQLIDLLKTEFNFTKHEIIARTGWTTSELTQAIEAKNLTDQFDIVSLLVGVNNQYRGQSLESYRTEFKQLLNISTKFSKNDAKPVMVLSIPDWGKTPFAKGQNKEKIASEIDGFNNVAKEECKKVGIVFIDITEITRKNTDASMFASDGLHYAGKMHRLWAYEALETAKKILK
jgi:lysophospholipase L1-like esterase